MKENTDIKTDLPLTALIEALLFVATTPVSISQLSSALNETDTNILAAVENLQTYYKSNSGLRIQQNRHKFQLTTSPDLAEVIERFLSIEITSTLSQASLEAMAIIAYKQPITRPIIDEIRGVNSDGVVRNLLSKGLIEEVGRVEGVGRPILYGTTPDFLSYFGLISLSELPAFDVLPPTEKNGGGILKD